MALSSMFAVRVEAPPPVPQVFLTLTALPHGNSGGGAYGGYSQYGGYSPGYEQQTARGGIIVAGHG